MERQLPSENLSDWFARGTGQVVRDFSRDQDAGRLRQAFPGLSQAQITAGLMYHARYRDEIQAKIDANAALTPEAIAGAIFEALKPYRAGLDGVVRYIKRR